MLEDNKVAVLLEQFLSVFRTFGEALQTVRDQVESLEVKTDGLIEDMNVIKLALKSLIIDMHFVKPLITALPMIDDRLGSIENEIYEL